MAISPAQVSLGTLLSLGRRLELLERLHLAGGILPAAGPGIGARQLKAHLAAERGDLDARLEVVDRALHVVPVQERAPQDVAARRVLWRELHRLLGERERLLVLRSQVLLERDLQHGLDVEGLKPQLTPELLDRGVRVLLQQEDAEGVVGVRGLGIAQQQLLVARARRRAPRVRPVDRGATRHQHHLALLGRKLRGQERQPQHREPERLRHAGALVALARQAREVLQALLELLVPRQQDAEVVGGDVVHLLAGDPHPLGALQVAQGTVVAPQLELAEPLERPRAAVVRRRCDDLAEGVARRLEALQAVQDRGEVPATLGPRGPQRERLLVEAGRLVEPFRDARVLGRLGHPLEALVPGRRRGLPWPAPRS
jgi:hypothetical protein